MEQTFAWPIALLEEVVITASLSLAGAASVDDDEDGNLKGEMKDSGLEERYFV